MRLDARHVAFVLAVVAFGCGSRGQPSTSTANTSAAGLCCESTGAAVPGSSGNTRPAATPAYDITRLMYGVPLDLDEEGNILLQPASDRGAILLHADGVRVDRLPHDLTIGRLSGGGEVAVGSTSDSAGITAVLFDGVWTDLNTLLCGSSECWANNEAIGIDAGGRIVGNRYSLSTRLSAYTISPNGIVSTLVFPGATSTGVCDVNFRGEILVHAVFSNSAYERAVIVSTSGEPIGITIPNGHVWANSINERSHVAGCTQAAGVSHPFIWAEGKLTDLGSIGPRYGEKFSCGVSISDEDVVVGDSSAPTIRGSTHFVYANGTMFDLDAISGIELDYVVRINAKGQILARDSFGYVVLLKPR